MSSQKQERPKRQFQVHRPAPPASDPQKSVAGGSAPYPSRLPSSAQQGMAVQPRPPKFAEEVRRNIGSNLDNPNLSAETVAKLHGIDRRTLSRRLGAEGTSFSELHRSLRYERARMLLCETAAPLSAITAALGYSEQSAFNRAFQIWSGISPKRFRSA
jgi:AraC-like DNA-binding protein